MGYDMYLRLSNGDKPPGDGYFRLNIWGMGNWRDAMDQVGMVHDAPFPGFPEYPGDEHYDWDEEYNRTPKTPQAEAYEAKLATALAEHGSPGMAMHKFCSNDGWHVTKEECASAVAAWEEYCDDGGPILDEEKELLYPVEDRSYWDEWITFLTYGATHDGFIVW